MTQNTKLAIVLFLIWTALVAGITWYILKHQNESVQDKIKHTIEIGTKKIDSVKTIRNQKLDSSKSESKSLVEKSVKILKTVKHEKIIIRDTTYDAMCKYIKSYRPE